MKGTVWRGGVSTRTCVGLPALALLAAALLAGCGSGGSSSTGSTSSAAVPNSPAASAPGSASSVDAVALVSNTPIPKASYEHWVAVERALGGTSNPSHMALGFLITSEWVLGEAAARHISVSEAEVKQQLAQLEKQSFPKPGTLQKFLAKLGETEADLLARIRVELLRTRIAAKITAGKGGGQGQAVLASFETAFQRHWRGYTKCKPGYVMEDCSEYRGGRENLTVASTPSSSSSAGSGSSRSSSSGASRSSSSSGSNASGEVPPPRAGAMAITSPAFELNGAIPTQYTCDGADMSPPLEWKNIPSKAAALVLFIIDDNAAGPSGGIRWIVGDINPTSKGVAAGKTPEGGIVGSDTQGHAGYGGICPAHGKTSTIEFVLYALSKRIPISPGFQPSIAESEYGSGKLLLGSAAVTYAGYHRP
jgi:Raf kinase inhibitor-like YbhB/YbcL family protein